MKQTALRKTNSFLVVLLITALSVLDVEGDDAVTICGATKKYTFSQAKIGTVTKMVAHEGCWVSNDVQIASYKRVHYARSN